MSRTHHRPGPEERAVIMIERPNGGSLRSIAIRLSRSPSTLVSCAAAGRVRGLRRDAGHPRLSATPPRKSTLALVDSGQGAVPTRPKSGVEKRGQVSFPTAWRFCRTRVLEQAANRDRPAGDAAPQSLMHTLRSDV